MLLGLALLLPGLLLLIAAELAESMTVLLLAATFGGIAVAFGYRGTLEVVNRIAPDVSCSCFRPLRRCAVVDAEDRCRPTYAVPLFRCFSEAVSMNLNHLVLIPFQLERTTRSRFARRMRIRCK